MRISDVESDRQIFRLPCGCTGQTRQQTDPGAAGMEVYIPSVSPDCQEHRRYLGCVYCRVGMDVEITPLDSATE